MADTHSLTSHLKQDIPDGDVFIHAGDFTRCGSVSEVREFNNWISKVKSHRVNTSMKLCINTLVKCQLPHKYKIVIAGNHELSFDPAFRDLENLNTPSGRSGHIGSSPLHICHKVLSMDALGMDRDQLQVSQQLETKAC